MNISCCMLNKGKGKREEEIKKDNLFIYTTLFVWCGMHWLCSHFTWQVTLNINKYKGKLACSRYMLWSVLATNARNEGAFRLSLSFRVLYVQYCHQPLIRKTHTLESTYCKKKYCITGNVFLKCFLLNVDWLKSGEEEEGAAAARTDTLMDDELFMQQAPRARDITLLPTYL